MDIYDSRYFYINKKLISYIGLWPFDKQTKSRILRCNSLIIVIIMIVPHVIGLKVNFGKDVTRFLENVGAILFVSMVFLKVLIAGLTREKFRTLYEDISKNWETITEPKEKDTLVSYSEKGRLITIAYISYLSGFMLTFISLPMVPMILDFIEPLNASRPHIFILNGEFLIDRNEHFGKLYVFDLVTCSMCFLVVVAVDSMYATCTEHCIGLFAIIKYRLRVQDKLSMTASSGTKEDESYQWMVDTITLHNKILKFTDTIETSYSSMFFMIMIVSTIHFAIVSLLILENLGVPLNSIRYTALIFSDGVHMFYLCWPGQKLIDYSSGLYRDAYCNEWYEGSAKCKRLLSIFTLRCSEPCLLTAGGLITMNFENFLLIMKRSFSYITVFSSFR